MINIVEVEDFNPDLLQAESTAIEADSDESFSMNWSIESLDVLSYDSSIGPEDFEEIHDTEVFRCQGNLVGNYVASLHNFQGNAVEPNDVVQYIHSFLNGFLPQVFPSSQVNVTQRIGLLTIEVGIEQEVEVSSEQDEECDDNENESTITFFTQ